MKKIFILPLLCFLSLYRLSGQVIISNPSAPTYNLDSIMDVSPKLPSIPSAYGKVVINTYDKLIDLIFLPSPPCPHTVSTVPGDTGQYIWIMTWETNDPKIRSDSGSYTNPDREAEPGSYGNDYTVGMANFRKTHPSYSVIGFEEVVQDSTVPAKKFLPYWNGYVSLYKKVNNKYVVTNMRFKYGWEYQADGTKKYNSFEYNPSVKLNQDSYNYHLKVGGAYPKILPAEPAKNADK